MMVQDITDKKTAYREYLFIITLLRERSTLKWYDKEYNESPINLISLVPVLRKKNLKVKNKI